MRTASAFIIGLSIVSGSALVVPEPPKAHPVAGLAQSFEASLSDAERARAARPLDDPERTKWYFARGGRAGLFLRDMDAGTRAAALALVDGDTAHAMADLIFRLNEEKGTTLVLVTHDLELARRCRRILRLKAGAVASDETV